VTGTAGSAAAGAATGSLDDSTPGYWLAVPAAGSGARFGGATPKQHLPLDGATVLEVTLRPFLADGHCRGIVVSLSAADPRRESLAAVLPSRVRIVTGGAERVDSVLAALDGLPPEALPDDWVLVHDAARPCLSPRDLRALLRAGAGSTGGALLATPLADTLKQADGAAQVEATLPRERLWRALTPQMFRRAALASALRAARAAGRVPTDEAQAMEWQGVSPLLVAAQDGNLKITTADDLAWAAATLARRAAADERGTTDRP
jgi:2-C-methyl-D-erythritol 4-phosphate cytidylyltransferase